MFARPREAVHPLIVDALPSLANELANLLVKAGEPAFAAQVKELRIIDRCRCGDDFCATFYTEPKPDGRWGPGHSCIELEPTKGMIILDVVASRISCVEVIYRDEVQKVLRAIAP